ncbi:phosphotransferase family protein [Allostella humosa]|uniref:phosphotransferase family protein n=1 Tax=Stella humosa TaxID=94 RepID=UPI00147770D9|nr:aminoglycoside phosphotransferase family protein [Stella humosa]
MDLVRDLVGRALPGARALAAAPVAGGLANTNLRVTLAGAADPVLLRIYQRDQAEAAKEAALHALVAGRVPVPRFLARPGLDDASGLHFAVLEWMPGDRMETVVPGLDPAAAAAVGRSAGAVLAAIHAVGFPAAGFLGPNLDIVHPVVGGRAGLEGFLRRCLVDGPGGARLGPAATDAALAFAAAEGDRLAAWETRACLVHGDFNGSNLLAAAGRVTAVLDWEFAFAGWPAFDFGNLLRPPAGDDASFVAGVEVGYRAAGGHLPADWRRLAAIADLYAWADFLARPDATPGLVRDAAAMIRRTIGSGG